MSFCISRAVRFPTGSDFSCLVSSGHLICTFSIQGSKSDVSVLLPAVSISNRENTVLFYSYAWQFIGSEFKFSEITSKEVI